MNYSLIRFINSLGSNMEGSLTKKDVATEIHKVITELMAYKTLTSAKVKADNDKIALLHNAYARNKEGYKMILQPTLVYYVCTDVASDKPYLLTTTNGFSKAMASGMDSAFCQWLVGEFCEFRAEFSTDLFNKGRTYTFEPYQVVEQPKVEPKQVHEETVEADEIYEEVSASTVSSEELSKRAMEEQQRIQGYAVELLGAEYAEYFENRIATDVKSIMGVYEGLFKAGLEMESPLGVLVPKGYMHLTDNKMARTRMDSMLAKLYRNYNSYVGNPLVIAEQNAKLSEENIDKGYTYFPEFQVRNAFGVTVREQHLTKAEIAEGKRPKLVRSRHLTWGTYATAVETNLKEIIIREIAVILKQHKRSKMTDEELDARVDLMLNKLRIALTSCIVMSEYDSRSSLKLRAYTQALGINAKKLKEQLADPNNPLFSGIGKVGLCNQDSQGVLTLSIIFDEEAEGRKPLFAFQAIEVLKAKGVKPSWENFILGKNVFTDTVFTVDLSDANSYNCVIGAGPRSGKGVTTLNILATALSEGFPIFYMDGKPEMTEMLWELGKKYKTPVFAVDTGDQRAGMSYKNYPKELEDSVTTFGGLIAYFKGLQLAVAMASLRLHTGENANVNLTVGGFDLKGKQRMVIVCDEIVKVKEQYGLTYLPFKDDVKKAGKKGTETSQWQEHVLNWLDALDTNVEGSLVSQVPMARQNWFWLTQKLDKTSWTISKADGCKTVVRGSIRTSKVMKLAGNGMTSGGNTLALPQDDKKGKEQADQYINKYQRCFAYHTEELPTRYDDIQIIKPYLLLPNNDPKGEPVRYLKQTPKEALRKAYKEDGVTLRDEIAFEGLVKMLLDDSKNGQNPDPVAVEEKFRKNLSVGYEVAYAILSMAGLMEKYKAQPYQDRVYAYMYDMDADTLIKTAALVKRVRMGEAYVESPEDRITGEGEGEIPTESIENDLERFSGGIFGGSNAINTELEQLGGRIEPTPAHLQQGQPTPGLPNSLFSQMQQAMQQQAMAQNTQPQGQSQIPTPGQAQTGVPPMPPQPGMSPEQAEMFNMMAEMFFANMPQPTTDSNGTETPETLQPFKLPPNPTPQQVQMGEALKAFAQNMGNIHNQQPGATQAVPNEQTNQYEYPPEMGEPISNQIDCSNSSDIKMSKMKQMLLKTPMGAKMYISDLWKSVLKSTKDGAGGIAPLKVTRIAAVNEQLYINDKLVNLSGVVNGVDGLRLSDIINFEATMNYFRGLKILCVDQTMLTNLFMEYNVSDIQGIFKYMPRITTVMIVTNEKTATVTRADYNKVVNNQRQEAKAVKERRRIERRSVYQAQESHEEYKRASTRMVQNWQNSTHGKKVWLTGLGVKCGDNAFTSKKKHVAKRLVWAGLGAGISVVGGMTWLTAHTIKAAAATYAHADIMAPPPPPTKKKEKKKKEEKK